MTKNKILSGTVVAGVSLMLMASILAPSMQTVSAWDEVKELCFTTFEPFGETFTQPQGVFEQDGVTLLKCYDPTDECFTGIQIKDNDTLCHYGIIYQSDKDASLVDAVPAEFGLVEGFQLGGDMDCSASPANHGVKADRSATKLECVDFDPTNDQSSIILIIWTETRDTPNGKWDKPTSCGPLEINSGVEVFGVDDNGDKIETDPFATTGPLIGHAIDAGSEDPICQSSNED